MPNYCHPYVVEWERSGWGQWRVVMLTLQYNPAGYSFVYPYKGMCSLNTWKGSLNQQTTTKKRRRGRHETRKSDVCWYCSCFFSTAAADVICQVSHSLTHSISEAEESHTVSTSWFHHLSRYFGFGFVGVGLKELMRVSCTSAWLLWAYMYPWFFDFFQVFLLFYSGRWHLFTFVSL